MGKSVRINVSLPEELQRVYAEVAVRTGVSLPQVLVNALVAQSAYTRRWMATWDFKPRDVPSPIDQSGAGTGADGGGVSTPAVPQQNDEETGRFTRQQRRAKERIMRKARR
jgi:hypothetical protein